MNDKAFSSIDLVGQCLLDKQRTHLFKDAINKIVTPEMIVLDAGTGSGILALFAAKAGASKVYAIERDPFIASIARKNIKVNNFEHIIEVIEYDIKTVTLPTKKHIDLVMMEMLTTGMIDESQVPAINCLKEKENIDEKTIFLPARQKSFISFGYSDFKIYGFNMPMILHLWDIHAKLSEHFYSLSNRLLYDDYDFSKDNKLGIEKNIEGEVTNPGKINAILIESQSILKGDLFLEETSALNGKVLIPIPEKEVLAGEIINGKIKYNYGGGFESLSFSW